jgi:hypothetical protein
LTSTKPFLSPKPSAFIPFFRRFTDERARDLADTEALYEEVRAAHGASPWSDEGRLEHVHAMITEGVIEDIGALPESDALAVALDACGKEVLGLETAIFQSADVDFSKPLSLEELVDLRRFLRAQQHFLAHQDRAIGVLTDTLFSLFAGMIPRFSVPPEGDATFTLPLYTFVPNLPDAVDRLIGTLCARALTDMGLCAELQEKFTENVYAATGIPLEDPPRKVLITAGDSKLPPRDLVETYLKGTPFLDLFMAPIPFELPLATRFEHHWIVAGSGHGKTQTLQYLIARDLERVAQGEASVVVIDSQGDLVRNIAGLKFFAENPDKLCLIDPTDIEWPVALNLFDVGMGRIDGYSPLDRERLVNSILELYDFVLSSLLSAELTQKQSIIFRYITRMMHIPDATIHTFRELMEPAGYEKYRPHIAKLQGTARAFFETEFQSKQFEDTKHQVVRRLWGILENQTFERMFSHPRNKLDLFSEFNAGKVVLINAAKELLKQTGTEIFGRFFIAMIAQIAQERATLSPDKRMPTFVYIDECQDYVDANVTLILEQARKYNVGMILAHQYIGQLPPKLQESLAANTSIKFAGGVSDRDARLLGHMLHCGPAFIESQPKGSFAAFIRNLTPEAVALGFPFGYLEGMERMTEAEGRTVREHMRARYAVHWKEVQQAMSGTHSEDTPHADPDEGPTDASSEWGPVTEK